MDDAAMREAAFLTDKLSDAIIEATPSDRPVTAEDVRAAADVVALRMAADVIEKRQRMIRRWERWFVGATEKDLTIRRLRRWAGELSRYGRFE